MPATPEKTQQGPEVSESLPAHLVPLQAVYCNGFEIGMGTSDVFVVLAQNGRRLLLLNLSYTSAKSLSEAIGTLIKKLEEKSGRKIMSSLEVTKFLSEKKRAAK